MRDRDGTYPAMFDQVLADAEITFVRTGVRTPRMNSIMARWVQIWGLLTAQSHPHAST